MMNSVDKQWLDEHKSYLYLSSRMKPEETQMLYDIYNRLTGENKAPNGCGTCLRNTLRLIKHYYERYVD